MTVTPKQHQQKSQLQTLLPKTAFTVTYNKQRWGPLTPKTTNSSFYITLLCERIGEEWSYTGYPSRAGIDLRLEAELSIVVLGSCLSAGILFLLV